MIDKCYIAGKWIGLESDINQNDKASLQTASNQRVIKVISPQDETVLAIVPSLDKEHAVAAIEAADVALKIWRQYTQTERNEVLYNFLKMLENSRQELAHLISLENGKVYHDAAKEVDYAISIARWSIEAASQMHGSIPHSSNKKHRIIQILQPMGVVSAITPWNFPLAMVIRKAVPALAAGCTVVLKPASATPLTAFYIAKLFESCSLPKGAFNVITGESGVIGKELCEHPKVAMITFTGSTEVGKSIMKMASSTVKKVSLELGGNAAVIIMPDADLEQAAADISVVKLRACGQACTNINRILVHKDVKERFLKLLISQFQKITMGDDGTDNAMLLGPLINQEAVARAHSLLEDAVSKGSTIVYQGSQRIEDKAERANEAKSPGSGFYFPPTIIDNERLDLDIFTNEIFAPIASIFTFTDTEEALALANNTEYGLANYLYTENHNDIWRMSEALESGMVGVNTTAISAASMEFGGVKQSGVGREGGKDAIKEFLETKSITINIA